jgi:hypothetical protein
MGKRELRFKITRIKSQSLKREIKSPLKHGVGAEIPKSLILSIETDLSFSVSTGRTGALFSL